MFSHLCLCTMLHGTSIYFQINSQNLCRLWCKWDPSLYQMSGAEMRGISVWTRCVALPHALWPETSGTAERNMWIIDGDLLSTFGYYWSYIGMFFNWLDWLLQSHRYPPTPLRSASRFHLTWFGKLPRRWWWWTWTSSPTSPTSFCSSPVPCLNNTSLLVERLYQ